MLITDLGVPGTNGRELAEMMRKRRPGLNVLLITGYTGNAAMKDEFLAEGTGMLDKPFTIDPLVHKLRSLLKH